MLKMAAYDSRCAKLFNQVAKSGTNLGAVKLCFCVDGGDIVGGRPELAVIKYYGYDNSSLSLGLILD